MVITTNHKNNAKAETCEMRKRFSAPDRMMAVAWQQMIGRSRRSNKSHGTSCWSRVACIKELRRNEIRRFARDGR